MAVVKTIKSGNVTIEIDDEYCKNTTEEEKQEILKRIGQIYYEAWREGKLKDHD